MVSANARPTLETMCLLTTRVFPHFMRLFVVTYGVYKISSELSWRDVSVMKLIQRTNYIAKTINSLEFQPVVTISSSTKLKGLFTWASDV